MVTAFKSDAVRSVIGDDHPGGRLGHVALHRRVIGKQGGGEIDHVVAAAGRREIGDRVLSEAGVEDEAVRPEIAVENVVVQAAVEDVGAVAAEEYIRALGPDRTGRCRRGH